MYRDDQAADGKLTYLVFLKFYYVKLSCKLEVGICKKEKTIYFSND